MTATSTRTARSSTPAPPPERQRLLRRNGFWLALSIVVCLVSGLGASLIQSSGGAVQVKTLTIEGSSGRAISALLLKPVAASAQDRRPVVVAAHGWFNTKEMQDANYVELARRGYVVLSIDMYGHGNSDPLPVGQEQVGGTGVYDAVQYVSRLPYIDPARIGVTGHSNGARAANFSVALDDRAATPLIRSVYLVDNDPVYQDASGAYTDVYGSRDVGVQADQYDEFFFRSYDADGTAVTTPRQYLGTPNAQSFLHFGADPATASDRRGGYTPYRQQVDGRTAIREVDDPAQTHPWGPFSKTEVTGLLTFFDRSLGTPTAIAPDSQIWQWKEAFNLLGLAGLAVFLVAFARALLASRAFAGARVSPQAEVAPRDRRGLVWFWVSLAVLAVVSGVSYFALQAIPPIGGLAGVPQPPLDPQGETLFIGLWAAVNGVVAIVAMVVSWRAVGRRQGASLRELGALPGWRTFGFGVLAGLATVAAAYVLVFLVGFLFGTDFRIWVMAVKPFTVDKLWPFLIYLPLFALYFCANSVAVNAFNRFPLRRREGWNTAVLAVAASAGPIVLVVWQYVTFFVTGELVPGFGGIFSIWLFPPIVLLAAAVVVSRKIARAGGNPYVGGIVMAGMVTMMSVTNTLTFTA